MNPRRRTGLAEVFASSVRAGIIASSSGSPRATPLPRRNVRLPRNFFEMIMCVTPSERECLSPFCRLARSVRGTLGGYPPHLERHALHDAEDKRGETIVSRRARSDDLADRRRIEMLNRAANGIAQEFRRHRVNNDVRTTEQCPLQAGNALEFLPIRQGTRHVKRGEGFGARAPGAGG